VWLSGFSFTCNYDDGIAFDEIGMIGFGQDRIQEQGLFSSEEGSHIIIYPNHEDYSFFARDPIHSLQVRRVMALNDLSVSNVSCRCHPSAVDAVGLWNIRFLDSFPRSANSSKCLPYFQHEELLRTLSFDFVLVMLRNQHITADTSTCLSVLELHFLESLSSRTTCRQDVSRRTSLCAG